MTHLQTQYREMVRRLVKPGAQILESLNPEKIDLLHMAIGLVGETTEFYQIVNRSPVAGQSRLLYMIEELGDIEFYLEGLKQVVPNYQDLKEKGTVAGTVSDMVIRGGIILDTVKKVVIHNHSEKLPNLITLVGLFDHNLEGTYKTLNLKRSQALLNNRSKLSRRYEQFQYTDEAAQARADEPGPHSPVNRAGQGGL